MPRVKRPSHGLEIVYDPCVEQIEETLSRFAKPSAAEREDAVAHAAKVCRHIAKAQRRWASLTPDEQRAWATRYHGDRVRSGGSAKPPKAADLPMLYAIAKVSDKGARKAHREYVRRQEARLAAEKRHAAETAERQAAELATVRAARPVSVPDVPGATEETSKRRKRARGRISVGVVAVQMPDGSRRAPIYDDDDL